MLGMQNMETVQRAMNLMSPINPRICVLQCTSAYPTPDDQIHLKVMATYRQAFPGSPVGYSGHELGLPISLAAAALGANVIERHFTLDKSLKGNDHACSLDPAEFKLVVDIAGLNMTRKHISLCTGRWLTACVELNEPWASGLRCCSRLKSLVTRNWESRSFHLSLWQLELVYTLVT